MQKNKKPGTLDAFIELVGRLSGISGAVAAGLIALGVLVICDVVIERYLLNRTTIWQIDVVTYCIVSATFKDLVSSATFSTNFPINLPSIIGGNQAYVGFTGADGGVR